MQMKTTNPVFIIFFLPELVETPLLRFVFCLFARSRGSLSLAPPEPQRTTYYTPHVRAYDRPRRSESGNRASCRAGDTGWAVAAEAGRACGVPARVPPRNAPRLPRNGEFFVSRIVAEFPPRFCGSGGAILLSIVCSKM